MLKKFIIAIVFSGMAFASQIKDQNCVLEAIKETKTEILCVYGLTFIRSYKFNQNGFSQIIGISGKPLLCTCEKDK